MFERAVRIAKSKSTDLRHLMKLAGGDARTFYRGAQLKGVDVAGQDLTGIDLTDVDFEGVIGDSTTKVDPTFRDPLITAVRNTIEGRIRTYRSHRNDEQLAEALVELAKIVILDGRMKLLNTAIYELTTLKRWPRGLGSLVKAATRAPFNIQNAILEYLIQSSQLLDPLPGSVLAAATRLEGARALVEVWLRASSETRTRDVREGLAAIAIHPRLSGVLLKNLSEEKFALKYLPLLWVVPATSSIENALVSRLNRVSPGTLKEIVIEAAAEVKSIGQARTFLRRWSRGKWMARMIDGHEISRLLAEALLDVFRVLMSSRDDRQFSAMEQFGIELLDAMQTSGLRNQAAVEQGLMELRQRPRLVRISESNYLRSYRGRISKA